MKQVLLRLASFWVLLLPALASAQTQGFAIDRYDVSERGSDWFVGDSLDLRGDMRPALGLVFDYAYRPLVLYAPDGSTRANIVSDQFFAHLGGSFVFKDRVRVAFNLPVALVTEGQSARLMGTLLAAESGPSLGDFRLSGDVRLAGEYGGPATLAIGAQLYLPTGSRTSFTGDGKVRFVPHVLLAGRRGRFDYAARLGLAFRAQHDEIAGVPFGSEIAFALSAGVSALDHRLLFGPELSGSTTLVDGSAFRKATTPVELLFGLHFQPKDFRTGIGIGPGLSRGLGSPTVRVVAMFEWAPSADSDRDHDGVFDVDDACPDLPGAMNADPAKNGCPLLSDRDQDGVPDAQDACPELVGVPNADPEKNGCPLSDDRDHDGVPDNADECPDVPGIASAVPQFNGCPADIDADGILNPLDACPTIPGVSDPDPLVNGCPLARIEKNQIIITQRIEFEFESATLLGSSVPVLTAVLDIMRGHPELGIVLVEGHTDSIGTAAYNKGLSERRAQSVRTWLVEHGVARARLLDAGFGLERPIDSNATPEGRQRNRRVEFHIIERDGKRLDTVGSSEVIHVR